MTLRSDAEPRGGEGSYDVGYCKPPAAYRFKKGRSGNPLGRPRRPRTAQKQDTLSFGAQPANQYLMQEAYRPVLVREGEQTIELPAIQAVFRAMGVAAMKGNRFAQRTLAELVQAVESADRKLREDHFAAAIEYKCNWERAIEQARELGQPEPQPIPHPDDIFLNFRTGETKVCGPLTKEDKADWDRALEHLDNLQINISRYAATFRKSRSEERKARALQMWMFEQKLFDRLNDDLPKRYRRSLKDRCWEKGATRPGQQSRHLWPDES